MQIVPIDLMWNRAERTREEGALDFEELLYLGEALFKTYVAGLIAAVDDDPTRQRYKLAYRLVRATGLGDWDEVLSDLSTGTPVQHLRPGAVECQREITAVHGPGSWMHDAVSQLHAALKVFLPQADPLPTKFDGRKWFSQFVYLRNKTRGHGAPTEAQKRSASLNLEHSLRLLTEHSKLFRQEWAFVKRNLSLKYHVVPLTSSAASFASLKGDSSKSLSMPDGVYVSFGSPVRVELIESAVEIGVVPWVETDG